MSHNDLYKKLVSFVLILVEIAFLFFGGRSITLALEDEKSRLISLQSPGLLWRVRVLVVLGRIAVGIVEVFFLLSGIYLLIVSYHLTDPLSLL